MKVLLGASLALACSALACLSPPGKIDLFAGPNQPKEFRAGVV